MIMPSKAEITAQQELLTAHRHTLSIYIKQQAIHGEAYSPPSITYGIYETREHIRKIKQTLRSWGVQVNDHPNDEKNVGSASSPPPPRINFDSKDFDFYAFSIGSPIAKIVMVIGFAISLFGFLGFISTPIDAHRTGLPGGFVTIFWGAVIYFVGRFIAYSGGQ